MSEEANLRLQRLLGGDALKPLRQRLRRHFEHAAQHAAPAILRVGNLTPFERETLAQLTGQPPRLAKSIRIEVALIDTLLARVGIADSLRDALEQLDGPILHKASADAERRAQWAAVSTECQHPLLGDYLQTPTGLGLLKRLARQDLAFATRLAAQAGAVLRRLPANGLPRSQLAADVLGNAHALDDGKPVATLVLAALRQRGGNVPNDDEAQDTLDPPAESARSIWARSGIAVNELARPVLVLNIPTQPGTTIGALGEPAYLSLRQLLRTPPALRVAGMTVFVCENPNIVAIAADALGSHCAPLVCTDGMPAAAQRTLLSQLTKAGARLAYHGDFDWPGLHIANQVIRTWDATPWRFDASDYQAAVIDAPHTERNLANSPVAACWDDAVATVMLEHGLAIPEEAVAAALVADLRR